MYFLINLAGFMLQNVCIPFFWNYEQYIDELLVISMR